MTKRETVRSAIAHQETEKVPYFINFTRDALPIIREQYDGEDLSIDIGNYVHWVSPPWWRWHAIPDGYRGYDNPGYLPKTRGIGSYTKFEEDLAKLKEETGCYILVMIYGSHFEKANAARGIEYFLADLGGDKEFSRKMLGKIIDKNMVMLENIVGFSEIDGILLGSDWGSQQALLMSPDCWRDLIAPGEQREYDLIKGEGKDIWIHSCGNIEAIIGDLIEMGVDVLNPVQPECMDIYKLKDSYGDRITFWGGISTQKTLPYGNPNEVRAEVAHVVEYMGSGGGYITSPAQEIQNDVPLNNMLALIDAAKQFG
ncbi:MAG: hypothetical protein CMN78_00120 [Spirochaetales bacterium]|nr:hypothetical protein [Spirochaetales bacterium]